MDFPSAYFSVFPGCKASGRRLKAAQPVGWRCPIRNSKIVVSKRVSGRRRCRSQLAMLQAAFANRFVRVAGNPSVSLRLPPPFTQGRLYLLPSHSGKMFVRPANHFRSRVKGRCPLWGAGATPRMVLLSPSGKLLVRPANYFRNGVQGTTLAAVGSRALPWPQNGVQNTALVRRRCASFRCGAGREFFFPGGRCRTG